MIKLTNLLLENPDVIRFNNDELNYRMKDAIGFGLFENRWLLSQPGHAHSTMDAPGHGQRPMDRDNFALPGRLWWIEKIITFWEYPTPAQFKKFMKGINVAAKDYGYPFKVDNSWSIEVVADPKGDWARKVMNAVGKDDGKWWGDMFTGLGKGYEKTIIPVSMYNGSGPRSKAEKGKSHMMSPMLKSRNIPKLKAMMQARMKKGNVSAKQKAMATKYKFTEGKQVGTLYHFTSAVLASVILKDNALVSNKTEKNPRTGKKEHYISLTRDKNFGKAVRPGVFVDVAFVIDGNKLSNNVKIQPHQFDFDADGMGDVPAAIRDEQEERAVVKKISNLKKFITGIIINTKSRRLKRWSTPEIEALADKLRKTIKNVEIV